MRLTDTPYKLLYCEAEVFFSRAYALGQLYCQKCVFVPTTLRLAAINQFCKRIVHSVLRFKYLAIQTNGAWEDEGVAISPH